MPSVNDANFNQTMKTKHTAQWHVAKTGNHQGLIVDDDGRNIAVAYDSADAPLIASAQELLDACKELLELAKGWRDDSIACQMARAAIAKATGGDK